MLNFLWNCHNLLNLTSGMFCKLIFVKMLVLISFSKMFTSPAPTSGRSKIFPMELKMIGSELCFRKHRNLTLQIVRCINSKLWNHQVKVQKHFFQVQSRISDGRICRPFYFQIIEASVESNNFSSVAWNWNLAYSQRFERLNRELRNSVSYDGKNSFKHFWKKRQFGFYKFSFLSKISYHWKLFKNLSYDCWHF